MHAFVVREPGGEFLRTEFPDPIPGPNQVLVKICASGVNPLDTKIRAGNAAHAKQLLPAVLGLDMAGIVEGGRP
jgi:NADPH:quinone reductase-like Zn-dependent oxidoreductase